MEPPAPDHSSEAERRIQRARLLFHLIVVLAYAGFLIILSDRQRAALLLETRVAALAARALVEANHGAWLADEAAVADSLWQHLPAALRAYRLASYVGTQRGAAAPAEFAAMDRLPDAVWQEIVEREEVWSGTLPLGDRDFAVSVVPLKDAEQWDVVGALLVAQPADSIGWRHAARSTGGWVGLVAVMTLVVAGYFTSKNRG